ncbi:MAG TPA: ABC transporter substrate-binding protein [Trebonia sp.]|nr:ABC transporter substrate-binding protein [Trebonia sp.]
MRIHKTRIVGASLSLLLGALIAACGSSAGTSTGTSASAAPATHSVTYLTDFIANGVYAPLFYGIEKGYYAQQGINLQVKFGTGSSVTVQDVASGQADIGDAFSGLIAKGVAGGASIKSVGFFRANGAFAFFCDKKLGITTFSGLKGKSVVIPPGTVQAALYPGVLTAVGLKPSEIKVDSIASAAAGADYAAGQGDCIIETLGDEPTFGKLRPSSTLLWSSGGFQVPGFAFFTTNAFLRSNPRLVEGFLKATYESITGALADPSGAVDAFLKANPQAKPALTLAQWNASRLVFCTQQMASASSKIGFQQPQAWNTVVSEMKTYEGLPASVDASSLYTNQFFANDKVSSTPCTAIMAS